MVGKLKPWPVLKTEEDVDAFVQSADLSEYDTFPGPNLAMADVLQQFLAFEAKAKDSAVYLRLPKATIDAYKQRAAELGVKYQKLMRQNLVQGLMTAPETKSLKKALSRKSKDEALERNEAPKAAKARKKGRAAG